MQESRSIEVRLPAGLETSADDLEVLRTTFQTIISLTQPGGSSPCERIRDMREQEWDVHWGVTWLVSARRGKDYEEATGRTREEAMERLREATCLHDSDGCP